MLGKGGRLIASLALLVNAPVCCVRAAHRYPAARVWCCVVVQLSVMRNRAVPCSALQCLAASCGVLCLAVPCSMFVSAELHCSALYCVVFSPIPLTSDWLGSTQL